MQIVCRDLVKTYPLAEREVGALNGVSFELTSGEVTVVVGRSGSGKTTLLNALGGLEQPTSGTVLIDGEELYARGDRELSRYRNERIGFVFQSFHLNGAETALENVLVPFLFSRRSPADPETRGRETLEAVDLSEQIDQPAGTLSAGQRQRVAIARALVNRPDFVLADEPTGNLDEETGSDIVAQLEALARQHGLGVVIVTHDPAITAIADRVLRLENGRLVE